jgi:hypothetical protein
MGSLKGQSANELLVIYMFVMLIFTIFIASLAQQRSVEMENSKVAQADSVGEQFANELSLAARSGNGYSKKIVYPILLGGLTPYTIILNNLSKSVDIKFSLGTVNYSHSFPIITSNIVVEPRINAILPNGTAYGYILQSSDQSFSTGQIYAQNLNGRIVISMSPFFAPNPKNVVMGLSGNYTYQSTEFANVTANVTDSFGSFVPDGTLVHFSTSIGVIDDFAPTVNGTATASLTIQTTAMVTALISGVSQVYTVPFTPG